MSENAGPRILDQEYRAEVAQKALDICMMRLYRDGPKEPATWDKDAVGLIRWILRDINDMTKPTEHGQATESPTAQLLRKLAEWEEEKLDIVVRLEAGNEVTVSGNSIAELRERLEELEAEGNA